MKQVRKLQVLLLSILIYVVNPHDLLGQSTANLKSLAAKPPMGWNSYNCYGATVMETEVKSNADYMSEKLKAFGWEYIVVDYCWFYPHPPKSTQNNPPQFRLKVDKAPVPWLTMDEWGRLLPDSRKFPNGFKGLADYVHVKGLKFGIHVMRGIPRQAVWAKTPIKGAPGIDASMIADTTSLCPWLNNMYGVDMSKPGAQEYYNSLADLYAEWGVDFIKIDDIDLDEKYTYRGSEAEAMQKAIVHCKRPIVLSLSLNMKLEQAAHVKRISNMWRISKDFWDEWKLLEEQFALTNQWTPYREPGNWPDADMLQLGRISRRGPSDPERDSRFTKDEQITHLTLWCIAQSPLMMGGDMPVNSAFVESLLTNAEVLQVNQQAKNARQLYRKDGHVVWVSESVDGKAMYVALFNLNDQQENVGFEFKQVGIKGAKMVRDLWEKKDLGKFSNKLSLPVNRHGARIFKVNL